MTLSKYMQYHRYFSPAMLDDDMRNRLYKAQNDKHYLRLMGFHFFNEYESEDINLYIYNNKCL